MQVCNWLCTWDFDNGHLWQCVLCLYWPVDVLLADTMSGVLMLVWYSGCELEAAAAWRVGWLCTCGVWRAVCSTAVWW